MDLPPHDPLTTIWRCFQTRDERMKLLESDHCIGEYFPSGPGGNRVDRVDVVSITPQSMFCFVLFGWLQLTNEFCESHTGLQGARELHWFVLFYYMAMVFVLITSPNLRESDTHSETTHP